METYWFVGKYISEKIATASWGDGVVKQLAAYIERTAPDLKGFDAKNLWRMRQLYEAYRSDEKLVTLSRQLSWSILPVRNPSLNLRFGELSSAR